MSLKLSSLNRSLKKELSVRKIEDEEARERGLEVLSEVYQAEKGWVAEREKLLAVEDVGSDKVSWFLAERKGEPLGVTRVLYELPTELYQAYGFQLVDPAIDVEAFLANNRIAEVGRFAVVPKYRKQILVAAILMRAATTETIERGFTHFITDVFENDPNSPYKFHRKILGFETVATHEVGELGHVGRRITMLLDFKAAYQRMSKSRNWIFRFITEGWNDQMFDQLCA